MALAPEISAFGDGDHQDGETGLTIDGGGFGAFPGSVWVFENADGSGAADELTVGAWNDIQLTGVEIPGSLNNVPGTVYLRVQREDLAWSQAFSFTLSASGPDTMPNPFSFTPKYGVALSSTVISEPVTITGINTTATATATNGLIDVNGDEDFQASRDIENGDQIRAQHTSGADYLTATNTVVAIDGVEATFTSRTRSLFGVSGAGIDQTWLPAITGDGITGPGVEYA